MDIETRQAQDLFITDLFRQSRWIQKLCQDVGEVWVTNDPVPKGHFTVYFGVVHLREGWYVNLHIRDLYFLHELWHLRQLRAGYNPDTTWLDWSRKMIRQELEASLASECFVYLEIPGLRERTFPHEIWMDRFLKPKPRDPLEADYLPSAHAPSIKDGIRKERIRAMTTPGFDDFLEEQIAGYRRQNHRFMAIWTRGVVNDEYEDPFHEMPAFRVVEEAMVSGVTGRPEDYRNWLRQVSGKGGIPFIFQADRFAKVVEESHRLFGNHLLTA